MTNRIEQPYRPETSVSQSAAIGIFVVVINTVLLLWLGLSTWAVAGFIAFVGLALGAVTRSVVLGHRRYRRLLPIWEAQQQADRSELSRREDAIADRGLVTIETQWCPPGEDDWYDDEAEAQGRAGKDVTLLSRSRLVTAYSAPLKTLAPGATVQVLQARFEVIGGTLEVNSRQGTQVTPYGLVDEVRDAWNYLHVPGGERTQLDHKVHLILPA